MSNTFLSHPFIYAAPFCTGHSYKLNIYYGNVIALKTNLSNAKISHNGEEIL